MNTLPDNYFQRPFPAKKRFSVGMPDRQMLDEVAASGNLEDMLFLLLCEANGTTAINDSYVSISPLWELSIRNCLKAYTLNIEAQLGRSKALGGSDNA